MSGLAGRLATKLWSLWFALHYRSALRGLGPKAFLFRPFRIDGAGGIELGAGSIAERGCWLYCRAVDGGTAALTIGKGCELGYNNHIAAVQQVVIGDHVLTANNVYISDNIHGYEDVTQPIMYQQVQFKGAVSIGAGSWLGENACVIGASVGRNCVIGANAVVTRDVPDYSVAVGVPARVIRRFDRAANRWVAVTK